MVMIAQFFGAVFGALAVVFGAFGAHAFKKRFTAEQLQSYEVGVKYQMYHAIILLVLGFNLNMDTVIQRYMVWCFILGIGLFSFSIYALSWSGAQGKKWRFLGPVTPVGGLFLVVGWVLLAYHFIGTFF